METQRNVNIEEKSIQDHEKREGKNRFSAFFDRQYPLFFAPFLVLNLYILALVAFGVYPFGEKTVASYDLSAQICPFIEHLFDVLQGKSTLTYSYAIVGGADVTGTLLYFFISPFSWLFLLFGDGKVAQATVLVMGMKLITISAVGTWFAKNLFKNIPDYLCIAIGVVYTYCGYTFVANTYINWLDFLIYAPLCVGAFCYFVKTQKFLPFSLLMSCCVYTCFSIACFSMFILFPTLIFYALLCVEKQKRNTFIAYLCLSFLVAVLLSLPVLLPAFMAYLRSSRASGLFDNLWYGFTLVEGELGQFNKDVFLDKIMSSLYEKWSYIFSDSIFVLLTLVWFYRQRLQSKFAKFMAVAGILVFLPTVVNESMLLLNMGSYYSYALRFGFLNAVYLLGGACLALDGICFQKDLAYDGAPLLHEENIEKQQTKGGRVALKWKTWQQNPKFWKICLGVIVGFVALLLTLFIAEDVYKDEFWELFFGAEIAQGMSGFSAGFAHSLGGLEVIIVLFFALSIVSMIAFFWVSDKKLSPRFVSYLLLIILSVQVVFYNNQLVVGNLSTQHQRLADYQTLSSTLQQLDDGYFRVKDYGKLRKNGDNTERDNFWTSNAPLTGGANSFSVFSSVIDADNFITKELFGYAGSSNNYKSPHATDGTYKRYDRSDEFGDSFMGYKYFFVPSDQRENAEKKSYLKKVMVEGKNGEETHLCVKTSENEKEHCYVYENTIVFPLGYRVNAGEFRFVSENTGRENRVRNQAALYEFLRGENLKEFTGDRKVTVKSATELSEYLWTKSAKVEVGAGKITATVENAGQNEQLFLNFVASKGYQVTVNGKPAELVDNDLKFLCVALEEGYNEVEFVYVSPYPKYMGIGVILAIVSLCVIAWVVKRTKFMQVFSSTISWAGILLMIGLVGFFFLFPTAVWLVKWVYMLL